MIMMDTAEMLCDDDGAILSCLCGPLLGPSTKWKSANRHVVTRSRQVLQYSPFFVVGGDDSLGGGGGGADVGDGDIFDDDGSIAEEGPPLSISVENRCDVIVSIWFQNILRGDAPSPGLPSTTVRVEYQAPPSSTTSWIIPRNQANTIGEHFYDLITRRNYNLLAVALRHGPITGNIKMEIIGYNLEVYRQRMGQDFVEFPLNTDTTYLSELSSYFQRGGIIRLTCM